MSKKKKKSPSKRGPGRPPGPAPERAKIEHFPAACVHCNSTDLIVQHKTRAPLEFCGRHKDDGRRYTSVTWRLATCRACDGKTVVQQFDFDPKKWGDDKDQSPSFLRTKI